MALFQIKWFSRINMSWDQQNYQDYGQYGDYSQYSANPNQYQQQQQQQAGGGQPYPGAPGGKLGYSSGSPHLIHYLNRGEIELSV